MVNKKEENQIEEAEEREEEEMPISDRVSGPIQKELMFEWEAFDRPFKALNKETFSTVLAGVFLLGVILFFIDGPIPVIMLASFVFLWYVLGTVKPGKTVHRVWTWGIETSGKMYVWELMRRFWIEGKGDNRMVVIELLQLWPRHLRLVIDSDKTEAELREILLELLVEDEPKPNWVDKGAKWLEKRIRWSVK